MPAGVPAPRGEPEDSRNEQLEPLWPGFVVRQVIPGFVATLVLSIGALGSGWLPIDTVIAELPVVDALRSTPFGAMVSSIAVIAGVLLLIQAWLLLGFDSFKGRIPDFRQLWIVLAAWSLPLILTPPLFSRDVYSYFTQGKLMVAGLNPYEVGSSAVPGWFNDGADPTWADSTTPYGQFFLLLERGVVEFSGPHPYTGAMAFRFIALIGVVMLAWAVPKLASHCGIDSTKALWFGVLNPLVLLHFVSGGHNDALMAGLVAMGLLLAVERYAWVGVLLVTLAGSVKPIALIALPFVGLIWAGATSTWLRRFGIWLITGAIAATVLLLFALLTDTGLGWINALSTPGETKTWLSPPTAVGMTIGFLGDLAGLDISESAVTIVRAIALLASVVVLVWLCLKPQGRTPIRGAALALLVVVVFGPVVQPWYLLWSIPLFAASGIPRWQLKWGILATIGFTVIGIVDSGSLQSSFTTIPDLVRAAFIVVAVIVLVLFTTRERDLIFGPLGSQGLVPVTSPEKARARLLVTQKPVAPDTS